MNKNIKTTGITLSPSIESYLDKKILAVEKLIPNEDTSAQLYIEIGKTTEHHKTGDVFFTELNLHIAGKNLRARQERGELFESIDVAKDDLVNSLKSYKGKQRTILRRSGSVVKEMIKGIRNFNFRRKK